MLIAVFALYSRRFTFLFFSITSKWYCLPNTTEGKAQHRSLGPLCSLLISPPVQNAYLSARSFRSAIGFNTPSLSTIFSGVSAFSGK
jgi:hypothetical protein